MILNLFNKEKRRNAIVLVFQSKYYSDTKTRTRNYNKEIIDQNSVISINEKVINKTEFNNRIWIQKPFKKRIHCDQSSILPEIQGWLIMHKSQKFNQEQNSHDHLKRYRQGIGKDFNKL